MKDAPLREGWSDRADAGLLRREQLYRSPWWKRALWCLGWCAAVLCGYPPRTSPRFRAARRKGER